MADIECCHARDQQLMAIINGANLSHNLSQILFDLIKQSRLRIPTSIKTADNNLQIIYSIDRNGTSANLAFTCMARIDSNNLADHWRAEWTDQPFLLNNCTNFATATNMLKPQVKAQIIEH